MQRNRQPHKEKAPADPQRMSRKELVDRLMHFPSRFSFDFTPDYLHSMSDEQLRHMLNAAYLYAYHEDVEVMEPSDTPDR